ncbi:hypothetical protein TGAM01_v206180 [Trichoderma gamsii]|uniref:Uncharacterized protein n=1 Tax=Trichoderma gamsii TaxID=398673 RepID=A0A2P4ZLD4_9HYPO|nr:hypothetical protein TGAM01_v206180 [Trichoderma gamsii]PON25099.1 hypothetical protein TGAM01_v206180 [Trichoderma gamsii]
MSPVISLLAKPRQRGAQPYQKHALIYFICGNPGLVNFYVTFLECLRGMLDAADEGSGGTAYDIYGRNLLGFSDDDHEPFSETNQPWDLDGQIEGIYEDVAARSVIPDDAGALGEQGKGSRPYDFVVLMGHSVGAAAFESAAWVFVVPDVDAHCELAEREESHALDEDARRGEECASDSKVHSWVYSVCVCAVDRDECDGLYGADGGGDGAMVEES